MTAAELEAGVGWADFVTSHSDKLRVGFRPSSVHAEVSLEGGAVPQLAIADRSVYVSDDDANYRSETKTYVYSSLFSEAKLALSGPSAPGEPRPTSIDTFSLPSGQVGVTIVWTYDNNPLPWKIVVGQRRAVFNGALAVFRKTGFRPISIASRNRGGLSEYAGIFVSDGVQATDWKVSLAEHWASLWETAETEWGKGYYAFRGTYEHGSETLPLFNVLWTKRSPEMKLEMRYNMDESLFNEQDIHWRKSGYHLETTCAYSDTGVTRYAGLWTRSDPYLRVAVGDSLDESGPTFAARYAPFEDSAIKVMTLEGTKSQGEYFRPSATLHIFEKGELVLNRAYTYAPAHYPDTSLNAKMALASASKSITAAAVVKELDTKGIPLTAPFAGTAGIVGVPNMVSTPTIVEVLRNLGGFNAFVDSYSNPSLMNMSYPIDGKAMYDYVVNGHLDAKTTDSYWDAGTYKMSQLGLFIYSNPGFSMLGELVRVQSGVPYAEYVRDSLLEPLNLHQEIYPDAGHRNAVDESTQAGLRSYLINSAHPYTEGCSADADCSYLPGGTCASSNTCVGCVVNQTDPTQNRPCRGVSACIAGVCTPPTPRLASEAPPKPANGDSSPKRAINAGPVLASAPDFASVFRYAGRVYMGGAPLAAGGWHGDGESLGVLVRTLAQYDFLMPFTVASQLWDPKWWNFQNDRASKWAYGLGWYARGNWIAMAGGADGTMSLILHNRQWDFTVVFLANVIGNGFSDFINPLLNAPLGWGSSMLGSQFPCADDPATITGNECGNILAAY
ncbi:serine hydrolase [Enhygromyxa salina]|uniref:serine hydrolase n=1 Tax=Enhygromyxa salina TaxID=215803 RepID=UPI0013FCFF85|nr:serine hydrolase [Enhygromyxa salina]